MSTNLLILFLVAASLCTYLPGALSQEAEANPVMQTTQSMSSAGMHTAGGEPEMMTTMMMTTQAPKKSGAPGGLEFFSGWLLVCAVVVALSL